MGSKRHCTEIAGTVRSDRSGPSIRSKWAFDPIEERVRSDRSGPSIRSKRGFDPIEEVCAEIAGTVRWQHVRVAQVIERRSRLRERMPGFWGRFGR
jgi:hypothetical protein